MTDPSAFAKMIPGFDFLQGLVKNAGAALPGVGQWIAPTLDPEVLEKKIEELRTVQFWLEQNARLLGATIQALEVQRMTLSTLKTMNVSLGDLTESLKIRMPEAPPPSDEPDAAEDEPAAPATPFATGNASAATSPIVPSGVADPMQWWGALTKQFTEIATNAMQGSATGAASNLAAAMVKQGFDAAGQTLKTAATKPMAAAKGAESAAHGVAKPAAGATRRPATAATKKSATRRR